MPLFNLISTTIAHRILNDYFGEEFLLNQMKKKMISSKSGNQVFLKMIIVPVALLLFAFTMNQPALVNPSGAALINDTLPQTEIFNLKRAEVMVVIMYPDMVKIRLKNQDSIMMNRVDFNALPVEVKKEISARNDGIFIEKETQIESGYPGGPQEWLAFLNRTFRYPEEAIKNRIEGTVVAQFIVDDKGKVRNIEIVKGPIMGGLREETIRVIQRSGRWEPAVWNGYKVTSYKKQPLTFRLTP